MNFCPDLFDHAGKRLDKKAMVNIKLMTSKNKTQIITINILPDISKSKVNQTMKISQLIEHIVRNIFVKNHAENEPGKVVPDPFYFL